MNQLAKSLYCVSMRNGVELWVEQKRVEQLQALLQSMVKSMFITFDDQTVNTADIVGIFSAETMADHNRRKNGQWQCRGGNWHERGERCQCASASDRIYLSNRAEAIRRCGKCQNGYVITLAGAAMVCTCVRNLV